MKKKLLIIFVLMSLIASVAQAYDSSYTGAQVDAEIARGIGRNTTVADPGSDAELVTEQAVREALDLKATIAGNETITGDWVFNGVVVYNEPGADVDFRIEGVGNANALFVQGSDGFVGIGTGTPGASLSIESSAGDQRLRFTDPVVAGNVDVGRIGARGLLYSSATSGYWEFYTAGDEVVRFHNSGGFSFGDDYVATDPGEGAMIIEGPVGVGTTSPGANLDIAKDMILTPDGEPTHGGYITRLYAATSGTLTGATDKIELNIPSDWYIIACQLHVKTVVTDDGGDDTWSSELNDGAQEEAISSGSAAAQNTNVNHRADADGSWTLTNAETDILLTPNGGSFTSGEIEAHCQCEGFDTWDNE